MNVSLITERRGASKEFFPAEPSAWSDLGLERSAVEPILLRMLLTEGALSGRELALKTGVPLLIVRDLLDGMRSLRLVQHRGAIFGGDFSYELTESGRERAFQARNLSQYVGPLPVPFSVWEQSVFQQASWRQVPSQESLKGAFSDLMIPDELLQQLGPALAGANALILHGAPGNGKTSIAERLSRSLTGDIWVPHAVELGGQILKVFDAHWHQPTERPAERYDRRWVAIERPTVLVGAELSLEMLEMQVDNRSGVSDAPLQIKAGGGVLIIDDFGRQRVPVDVLLNRWIAPLERRRDFLRMGDGQKIPVPFGALLVLASNLDINRVADEAFLRRIPNKIYLQDPTQEQFFSLTQSLAKAYGVQTTPEAIQYLIQRHYRQSNRHPRFCHPRDLVRQVASQARWEGKPAVAGEREWDLAVGRLFGES